MWPTKLRVLRPWAAVVMVEILHGGACPEKPVDVAAVLLERNVEHDDFVTGASGHPAEQFDVALDARHENCVRGIDQTQLL